MIIRVSMMSVLPPLKALRVFEACVRLGSFTRAARELNVGQPAISHQIQVLEQDLGVCLFERRGAQTLPTSAAQTYYRSIADALTEMARATQRLRRSVRCNRLTLGTYPGLAMFWLMPRLAAIRKIDPALMVRVVTAERDQDILSDEIDCAILFGDDTWPGYVSHLLMRESVVPIAAPVLASRLDQKSRAALIEDGPLIHLQDPDGRWFNWQDWRDRRAATARHIDAGVEVTNHALAIHQALMGQGIALGWSGIVEPLIKVGQLLQLDTEPLSSDRGYYLVGPRDFLETTRGQRLRQSLTTV